jgi:hypothetical protein
MKASTKFLVTIGIIGLLYSLFRLFSGNGGSGLGDFNDSISITLMVLSFSALLILVFNLRNLKNHFDTIVFFLAGLPMAITIGKNLVEYIHYNRNPDLTYNYQRPVTSRVYLEDSSRIATQIDSLVALKNRNSGGVKIERAFIDTIVYSQTGRQVLVIYIQKFEPNDRGNDFDPAYLHADERDSIFWHLEEGTPNAEMMSGSFHDVSELKKELRKFYFNQYHFEDADSLKENYIWKRPKHRIN